MKILIKILLWGLFIFSELSLFDVFTQQLIIPDDINMLFAIVVLIIMVALFKVTLMFNKYINKFKNNKSYLKI